MTEEEAKQKWCPMVRAISTTGEGPFNRSPKEISTVVGGCVGSLCMMWRWRENYHQFGPIEQHKPYGYCGLGGKP